MNEKIDPVADLLGAFGDLMPEGDRLLNLKKVLEATHFCDAQRDKMTGGVDHSECCPLEALDTFFQKMKDAGISIEATIPGDKNKESFIYALFRRLNAQKCDELCDLNEGKGGALAKYLFARAKELGVPDEKVGQVLPLNLPEIVYCRKTKDYWIRSPGGWQPVNRDAAADHLAVAGVSSRKDDSGLSEIDRVLANIRDNKAVDMISSLAGYPEGIYNLNGNRILVDRGFELIEPAAEDGLFEHVEALFWGLLSDPDGKTEKDKGDPYWHLLAHLKQSYLELKNGERSGSLATFLCGPTDCGKTLLIEILVKLLGGRYGNAYQYIAGETSFNDELMTKECWLIDDGVPMEDYTARKRLNGLVKQAVAAGHVACHGKGKAQVSLPLYRRLFVALNPEDMDSLPHLDESMGDKYMLLKAKAFQMPDGCLPLPDRPGRLKFMATLVSELPFFLRWLLGQNLSAYAGRRFGVIAHKDSGLAAANLEASGLDTKYAVICDAVFGVQDRDVDAVELKTCQIWLEMKGGLNSSSAASLFRSDVSLGKALSELSTSTSHGKLVTRRVLDGYSLWTIHQQVSSATSLRRRARSKAHLNDDPDSKGENRP